MIAIPRGPSLTRVGGVQSAIKIGLAAAGHFGATVATWIRRVPLPTRRTERAVCNQFGFAAAGQVGVAGASWVRRAPLPTCRTERPSASEGELPASYLSRCVQAWSEAPEIMEKGVIFHKMTQSKSQEPSHDTVT